MISRTFGMERSSSYCSYIDLVIEDSHKILQKVLKRNILSRYFQGFSKIFGDLCKILEQNLWRPLKQGPCSKFLSWGLKKNVWRKFFLGGVGGGWGLLWFSIQFLLSDGECYYNEKAINFFPHLQWCCYGAWKFTITKLKYHRFLCYTTDINL